MAVFGVSLSVVDLELVARCRCLDGPGCEHELSMCSLIVLSGTSCEHIGLEKLMRY